MDYNSTEFIDDNEEGINNYETQYPKKGKKLFIETNEYYEFAHFGWGIKSQFYGYITGYKGVADSAVELAVNSKDIKTLDTYVFPIFFNYRQFLELSLKSLYLDYSTDLPKDKVRNIKEANHNLMKMWNHVEPIFLSTTRSNYIQNMVKVVRDYVQQYHQMDKTSFNFRYPVTKELYSVFEGEQRIDLLNLKSCMQELSYFFDGMDGALDDLKRSREEAEEYIRELKEEFEADMRADIDWD